MAGVLIFLGQLLVASPRKSAAFDEQYHLVAGYTYLKSGDFRLASNHPPLMGTLAAISLLGRKDIELPLDHPAWEAGDRFLFSDVFLWETNTQGPELIKQARYPVMAIGVLLIAGIFFWAGELYGKTVRLLIFFLALFEPNILANSRVITTDLGLTAFLFLAVWQFWRWLEGRSASGLLLSGILGGLAAVAKYTGLLFGPAVLLIALLVPVPAERSNAAAYRRRAAGLLGIGLIAAVTVWASYLFDVGPVSTGLGTVYAPAPYYIQQLLRTYGHFVSGASGELSFLLGESSASGWWFYFPVALAFKTPLPLLILVLAGVYLVRQGREWRALSALWVPPLLFLILGMTGVLTIGYRHILPAIPFLILWAGLPLAEALRAGKGRRIWRTASVLLVLWSAISSLRLYPHQEAYFNELAGSWTNWSTILVDSNLDWGQDLPALRTEVEKLGIKNLNFAYFGKAKPEAYGLRYRPLPGYLRFIEGMELNAYNPHTPEPGWYAISATSLRLGLLQPESVDLYSFFRSRRPDARAGYSIYLYWVAYPDTTQIQREIFYDRPVAEQLAMTQTSSNNLRIQAKWAKSSETVILPLGEGWKAPDSGFTPLHTNFADVLTLLGFAQETPRARVGDDFFLNLHWQIGHEAMPQPAPTRGRPLSAFVQIVERGGGRVIEQYDGWETALRGLEPGDVVIQRVRLGIDNDDPPGTHDIVIGLYSPQDGQRLEVEGTAGKPNTVVAGELRLVPPASEP